LEGHEQHEPPEGADQEEENRALQNDAGLRKGGPDPSTDCGVKSPDGEIVDPFNGLLHVTPPFVVRVFYRSRVLL
jgi:hypothetical protein